MSQTPSPILFLDPQIRQFCTDSRIRGHRPDTLRLRRRVLGNAAAFLGKALLDADEDDLLRWYRQYADHSQATRVSYGRAMRSYWAWALNRRLVTDDVSLVLPIPRNPMGQPRPIPLEDLTRAMAAADARMRLWLALAVCAGLRAGEVARLRRDDVEGSGDTWLLHVREGKGGKPRTVGISTALALEVHGWQSSSGRLWSVTAGTVSGLVSTHMHGLGIDATLHAGRHLFGTTFYRASGHDLFATMQALGHSSPSSTRIYAKSDPARSVEALVALDALLNGDAA